MATKNKVIVNPKTGQQVKFIRTGKDTEGKQLEMETTYRAGSTEPPQHYHPSQTEDFKVLSGTITVRMNEKVHVFHEGDQFHVAKNTCHSMWNASNSPTVVSWTVTTALNTEHLLETNSGLASDGKVGESGTPGILQASMMLLHFSNVFRLAKPSFTKQRIIFSLLFPIAYIMGYRATYKKYLD